MKSRWTPKRILMTADALGGVWTHALELARALGRHNIQIALATMGAPLNRAQRAELLALDNTEVFEGPFKLEWMNNPWPEVGRAGEWLLKLENEWRPDLVHLNQFAHGALPWRAPTIVAGHSCVLSWWRAAHGCDAPANWDRYRAAVTEGLQLADFVVAPSRAMLQNLADLYGPFAFSAVVPNGRALESGRPRAKHEFILCAGRLWDEGKNIVALARVASQLSWPVYLAGQSAHPCDGRDPAFAHVHRLGPVPSPHLFSWFQRAAIYALPARYEPFGLTVLEAALCGCALVLGDIPSLRENWDGAALFVPPGDESALRDAIEQLISKPDFRRKMAAEARRAAARFTPETMVQGYLDVYARAAAARSQKVFRIQAPPPVHAVDSGRRGPPVPDRDLPARKSPCVGKGAACAS